MNITTHCRERYIERILGIEDPKEIREYSKNHLEEIENKIKKLYEDGQLIFQGSLYSGKQESLYILNEDIVIVVDEIKENIVTLYKVDFGFPEKTNKKVVKDLVKEIGEKNREIEQMELDNINKNKQREVEIENIDLSIKAFETRIKELETKKRLLSQEEETENKALESLEAEKDRLCKMICNSLDYKLDLLAM